MNILDYKRKTAGYFYRAESDYFENSLAANGNPKYISVNRGYGDYENWVTIPNPKYVPPAPAPAPAPTSAPAPAPTPIESVSNPEAIRAKIAKENNIPASAVTFVYGTMTGGRDDNTQVTDYSNVVGYDVPIGNGQIQQYGPSGQFQQQFAAKGPEEGGLVGSISRALADLDSSLGLSKNAPAIVGAAAAYFLPGIGAALGQSLVNAGVLTGAAATPAAATAIGTALAQTGISVAQGKPLDQALGNAIISGGIGELSKVYGADVKSAISQITENPIAQNAIFKAGTGVVSAVAQGKTGDDVLRGIGNSVVSSVANDTANTLANNIPGIENLSPAQQNIVKAGVATSILGGDGTKSMVNAALKAGTTYALDALTSEAIAPGTDGTTGAMQGGFGDTSKLTDEQIQDIITGGQTSLGPSPTNQESLDSIGYTGPELSDDEIEQIITGGGTSLGPSPTNQEILDAIGYEPTEDVTLGSGILGSDKSGAAGEVPLSELPLTDVGSFGPVVEVTADGYPAGTTGGGGKGIGGGGGGGARPTALPAKSSPAGATPAFVMPQYQTTTTVTKPGELVGEAGWTAFDSNTPIDYTPFSYKAPEKIERTPDGAIKMAHGGSVDELLAMLHSQKPESAGAGQTFDSFLASLRERGLIWRKFGMMNLVTGTMTVQTRMTPFGIPTPDQLKNITPRQKRKLKQHTTRTNLRSLPSAWPTTKLPLPKRSLYWVV